MKVLRAFVLVLSLGLSGCGIVDSMFKSDAESAAAKPYFQKAPTVPVASDQFEIGSEAVDVVGQVQVVTAGAEDTLSALARLYNLGYDEITRANPDVDPWLPGDGTPVYLPTQFILPDAPRDGIVLNLANMRLFYFPDPGTDGFKRVITHPIGIGRRGWSTPTGSTTIVGRARDPVWFVPSSVRREHRESGDPLPSQVPPGPDNPLGKYVLQLALPGYLIHGTNKPYGVGMRISHGCVRMYPEDIAVLFGEVAIGTPVYIVNQPYLAGWRNGVLYLEAHEPFDDANESITGFEPVIDAAISDTADPGAKIDWQRIADLVQSPRGFPIPISTGTAGLNGVLVSALKVQNRLPLGSNWDGVVVVQDLVILDESEASDDTPAQAQQN